MTTGRLLVRVWTEERHRLLPGATVALWTAKGHLPERVTDASGSVEVGDLDEGWVGARAVAPGHAMSDPKWATIAGDGTAAVLHFRLEPGVPVEGVVVARETNAPVAGARVEAVRNPGMGRRGVVFAATTTDDSGRFRIDAVPRAAKPHQAVVLVASCEAFATTDHVAASRFDDPGPVQARIELAPGGAVRGTVHDFGGKPIAGAHVDAHRAEIFDPRFTGVAWTSHASGATWIVRPRTTETDGAGRFDLTGLERGADHVLVAKAKGSGPATARVVPPAPPLAAEVDFVLPKPGGLELWLVDTAGADITDAQVSAGDSGETYHPENVAPGRWRLRDLPGFSVSVFVESPRRRTRCEVIDVVPGQIVAKCLVLRAVGGRRTN